MKKDVYLEDTTNLFAFNLEPQGPANPSGSHSIAVGGDDIMKPTSTGFTDARDMVKELTH